MKIIFKIFLLVLPTLIFSQKTEFIIDPMIESKNGCFFKLTPINQDKIEIYSNYCTESESYFHSKWVEIKNSDSMESVLMNKYPVSFKKTDLGFIFINHEGESIEIERSDPDSLMREIKEYKIIANIENYILVFLSGYEWWHYELIDFGNATSYRLPGKPIFINSYLLYGYTNYYGSGEIAFIDIKMDRDVTFCFEQAIQSVKYSSNLSMGTLIELKDYRFDKNKYLNVRIH